MNMTKDSARLLGQLMGSIQATDEDTVAVGLTLETEENAQKFFAWAREQKENPTPQACFEQAVKIAGIDGLKGDRR